MRHKKIQTPDFDDFEINIEPDTYFCTECGKDLEDFVVSEKATDKKAILENFKQCLESGKFKGDMCSKLFIIKEDTSNGKSR